MISPYCNQFSMRLLAHRNYFEFWIVELQMTDFSRQDDELHCLYENEDEKNYGGEFHFKSMNEALLIISVNSLQCHDH
jgi:hypothetical protein